METKPRIIFVGIHNKPGMEPLDSRTKSGKIIDEVIKGLGDFECVKTNLFDLTYLPNHDPWRLAKNWICRIGLLDSDTVVQLGRTVVLYSPQSYLLEKKIKVVAVEHPASRHIKKEQYIQSLISKILEHG